jgi:hypothetical protein
MFLIGEKTNYCGRRCADEEGQGAGTESQAKEIPPSREIAKGECLLKQFRA